MKKPNKSKQHKDLLRGKKKAARELNKKRANKTKRQARLAEKIKERQANKETFQLEDEVRRIQNRGLTMRKPRKVVDKE
jgi:hypothetical protein